MKRTHSELQAQVIQRDCRAACPLETRTYSVRYNQRNSQPFYRLGQSVSIGCWTTAQVCLYINGNRSNAQHQAADKCNNMQADLTYTGLLKECCSFVPGWLAHLRNSQIRHAYVHRSANSDVRRRLARLRLKSRTDHASRSRCARPWHAHPPCQYEHTCSNL